MNSFYSAKWENIFFYYILITQLLMKYQKFEKYKNIKYKDIKSTYSIKQI